LAAGRGVDVGVAGNQSTVGVGVSVSVGISVGERVAAGEMRLHPEVRRSALMIRIPITAEKLKAFRKKLLILKS